jgi:hypothetical protein
MKQPSAAKPGHKLLERVPPDHPPHLTGRDEAILQAIYMYKALTTRQVELLFFPPDPNRQHTAPSSQCRDRLRLLFHAGFLQRKEQPWKPLVYLLDRAGARLVAHRLGLTEPELNWIPRDKSFSDLFLDHLLATNDVMIAITLSCRTHGWMIDTWYNEQALKSTQMKDTVTITNEAGRQQRVAIVPDGYVAIHAGEYIYDFFLELDRGTVTVETTRWGRRDWTRKVKAYQAYFTPPEPGQPSLYEQRYQATSLRILTITTGEPRLKTLKAATEAAAASARFWFTTQELATSQDILTDPIFQQAGKRDRHALIW